jgi:hypothetical protein
MQSGCREEPRQLDRTSLGTAVLDEEVMDDGRGRRRSSRGRGEADDAYRSFLGLLPGPVR